MSVYIKMFNLYYLILKFKLNTLGLTFDTEPKKELISKLSTNLILELELILLLKLFII